MSARIGSVPPALVPALDTSWTGQLELFPNDNILGSLRDRHGWLLTIVGAAHGRNMLALRALVRTPGLLLLVSEDQGIRSDLTERLTASWPWTMTRAPGDAWAGVLAQPAWRLAIIGQRGKAGHLALTADMQTLPQHADNVLDGAA